MVKKIQIITVISFITLLFGCQKNESTTYSVADDPLFKVSKEAATIKFFLKVDSLVECSLAKVLNDNPQKNLSNKHNVAMKEMLLKSKASCEIYEKVRKESEPIFDEIISKRTLPNDLYIFKMYSETENEKGMKDFSENKIGFFNNLGSCQKIREIAVKANIPTTNCSIYVSEF